MRKKLLFAGMIVLALALTTGTFAYTYTNASATPQATMADGNYAAYQKSIQQPNWNSLLPNASTYIEQLVPIGNGCEIGFPIQFPCSGAHWEKVADLNSPNMDAFISTLGSCCMKRDIFCLSPFTGIGGTEKITSVTVFFRIAAAGDFYVTAKGVIKNGYQIYEGPDVSVHGTSFETKSWSCSTNPATGKAWTWAEVNNIQAGVSGQGYGVCWPLLCTSVYVQVKYTYALTQGDVPTGDLYDITPHPEYTGDLAVKIYITNTAALLKAYEYLNMKIYMTYSLEAEKTPVYQVLSLENGVTSFNIQGGTAATYKVSVIGGGYRIISDNPEEWGPGWSLEPEFFCEVAQR